MFGAYIQLDQSKEKYAGQIKYTAEQKYLCCYHTGSYETIMETVNAAFSEYSDVKLSKDFICINIVDQFLENNTDQFITEIHIPVLD